ncbi:hypothetical protein [Melittangium boletus]|uniref:Lipoprotein n=1 Tax=Melittangium boletus DSM 14713 TaxID=1294270 RepID=A0A250IP69_9BACT|nr:hypothetical protein [Melittangium boletus]ATB33545.1 hypothetical protein MEBOL_007043 [Melittangium boletus DSM 14713]
MKKMLLRGAFPLFLALACSPLEETDLEFEEAGQAAHQALEEDNGLAFNGLAFNGLAFNGLAFNGLAFNGLNHKDFVSWFNKHPEESDTFMKYLVRCAVPAGQHRTYWDGRRAHIWNGHLGLAPAWVSGSPATREEQQAVSACLGALTNKYGLSVLVSLRGTTAAGASIPVTSGEQADHTLREGCFFGNLFNGEGLFVGNDSDLFSSTQSSLRACALMGGKACPPLKHIGSCHAVCQPDATGSAFSRCTYKGVSYHAITTRIRPQDVYTCGDGICQSTESCGKHQRPDSCKVDCGKC